MKYITRPLLRQSSLIAGGLSQILREDRGAGGDPPEALWFTPFAQYMGRTRNYGGFVSKKWQTVSLLALAELLAMGLWFSASAVTPALTTAWNLSPGGAAWSPYIGHIEQSA